MADMPSVVSRLVCGLRPKFLIALALTVAMALAGCGTGNFRASTASGSPLATISVNTIAFAQTTVGSASLVQSVTLTNSGTAPLLIAKYVVSDSVDFALATTCGTSLAVQATCSFSVTFQPQTAQLFTAALTITDDSVNVASTQRVDLSGAGAAPGVPQAVLSPASLSFPQTAVGSTSAGQTILLSNVGNATLNVGGITIGDPRSFLVSSTCSSVLAAGTSCSLTAAFRPQNASGLSSALTVTDNSGGVTSSQSIALTGTGLPEPIPQVTYSVSDLLFTSTGVGVASPAQAVTVKSSGDAPVLISGISVSDPADFVLTNNCPALLPAAATCSVSIVFKPGSLRSASAPAAAVTFTDNAGGATSATQTIALRSRVVSSVTNFGDSITCGLFAYPNDGTGYVFSLEGYAGLLDTTLGVPARNFCRSGDQAADMARLWVYPNTKPVLGANQLYSVLIGTNDANFCGNSTGCEANYTSTLAASLAWLGMPATDKVLAADATQSGYWFFDSELPYALKTTAPGSTLTFTVQQAVAGRTLDLVNRIAIWPFYAGGKAEVTVDGVFATTLHSDSQTGVPNLTLNSNPETEVLTRVALGAVGSHSVTITNTSPNGITFDFIWAGVSTGSYANIPGAPRVLVGGPPTTQTATLVPLLLEYDDLLAKTVAGLAAEGLDVELVPTAGTLDTATDFHDALHPNNQGHQKLVDIFLKVF